MWVKLQSGVHEGRTLPEVAFRDPKWLFSAQADEEGREKPALLFDLELVRRRARSIKLPASLLPDAGVEFVHHARGEFGGIQIGHGARLRKWIDLQEASTLVRDATGLQLLLRDVKLILFGDPPPRMTKQRCESFFDDPTNFRDP